VDRPLLWVTMAVLGIVVAVLWGVGGPFVAGLFALLTLPLITRADRLVAVSGLVLGFGAIWLLLMARQALSGGALDAEAAWVVVGALPLTVGIVALAAAIGRRVATRTSFRR
jgi:uncharacterized membrane protein